MLTFRPLTSDAGEGEQDAGLYKSRFGRIVVKGTVKGGWMGSDGRYGRRERFFATAST